MQHQIFTLNTLFAQLGLDNSDEEIEHFIESHRPLTEDVPLNEAPFWNDSQKALLKEALSNDSDWAEVVDQLNSSLRTH